MATGTTVVIVSTLVLALSVDLAQSATPDLVGHWAFERIGSVATDSSGNGNHGVLQGMTDANRVGAKVGRGIGVTRATTFVSVPHSSSLDLTTSGMTVAAWVRLNSFVGRRPGDR